MGEGEVLACLNVLAGLEHEEIVMQHMYYLLN